MNFSQIIETRRSIYALGKEEILPQEKIIELISHAVKHCPSAFNSQSARTVILFDKHHKKLWDIVLEELKPLTPEKSYPNTVEKIEACFKSGYGTVLFFEDQTVVEGLQKQFALYAENFPKWSLQSNGMLEYIIWCSLAENKIGATLQHYNPIIDARVMKEWNLPSSWKLLAQMPFGSIKAPADKKEFMPLEARLKIFK